MKEVVKEKIQSLIKDYAELQTDGSYHCICPCCRGPDGTGFTRKKSRETIRHHLRYMLPRIVVMESNSAQYRHLPPGSAPYPTPSGALQTISTSNVIQEAHAPRPYPASTVSSAPVQQHSSLDSDSVPAVSIQPISVESGSSHPTLMPTPASAESIAPPFAQLDVDANAISDSDGDESSDDGSLQDDEAPDAENDYDNSLDRQQGIYEYEDESDRDNSQRQHQQQHQQQQQQQGRKRQTIQERVEAFVNQAAAEGIHMSDDLVAFMYELISARANSQSDVLYYMMVMLYVITQVYNQEPPYRATESEYRHYRNMRAERNQHVVHPICVECGYSGEAGESFNAAMCPSPNCNGQKSLAPLIINNISDKLQNILEIPASQQLLSKHFNKAASPPLATGQMEDDTIMSNWDDGEIFQSIKSELCPVFDPARNAWVSNLALRLWTDSYLPNLRLGRNVHAGLARILAFPTILQTDRRLTIPVYFIASTRALKGSAVQSVLRLVNKHLQRTEVNVVISNQRYILRPVIRAVAGDSVQQRDNMLCRTSTASEHSCFACLVVREHHDLFSRGNIYPEAILLCESYRRSMINGLSTREVVDGLRPIAKAVYGRTGKRTAAVMEQGHPNDSSIRPALCEMLPGRDPVDAILFDPMHPMLISKSISKRIETAKGLWAVRNAPTVAQGLMNVWQSSGFDSPKASQAPSFSGVNTFSYLSLAIGPFSAAYSPLLAKSDIRCFITRSWTIIARILTEKLFLPSDFSDLQDAVNLHIATTYSVMGLNLPTAHLLGHAADMLKVSGGTIGSVFSDEAAVKTLKAIKTSNRVSDLITTVNANCRLGFGATNDAVCARLRGTVVGTLLLRSAIDPLVPPSFRSRLDEYCSFSNSIRMAEQLYETRAHRTANKLFPAFAYVKVADGTVQLRPVQLISFATKKQTDAKKVSARDWDVIVKRLEVDMSGPECWQGFGETMLNIYYYYNPSSVEDNKNYQIISAMHLLCAAGHCRATIIENQSLVFGHYPISYGPYYPVLHPNSARKPKSIELNYRLNMMRTQYDYLHS